MSRDIEGNERTFDRTFCLKSDTQKNAWGREITLPKGARVVFISGPGGGFAIEDEALLVRLTGNTHDPKYRYLWLNPEDVERQSKS